MTWAEYKTEPDNLAKKDLIRLFENSINGRVTIYNFMTATTNKNAETKREMS